MSASSIKHNCQGIIGVMITVFTLLVINSFFILPAIGWLLRQ